MASTIPPFEKLRDLRIWEDEKPPAGTLYNYPPRGDVTALLAGYPAPTTLGAQMFAQGTICKLVAQCTQQGKSIDQAIDAARGGRRRTGGEFSGSSGSGGPLPSRSLQNLTRINP